MSCDQSYPFPQVFLVDSGASPQQFTQPPRLVPCLAYPPAQEKLRSQRKSQGFMGIRPCVALIVLFLFLLVFAALGIEAYQIYNLQTGLREMQQSTPELEFNAAQKQIGLDEKDKDNIPAAHVIGRVQKEVFHKTLRWEQRAGQAFISGGVSYLIENGGLQVNDSGLYHIYSRVELIFKHCSPTSSFVHSVFVRRMGYSSPLTLMEAHRAGFCPQQPDHPWTSESYLGSALKLRKYDRVFVNVSQPMYLSHSHYGNFFGLYKI